MPPSVDVGWGGDQSTPTAGWGAGTGRLTTTLGFGPAVVGPAPGTFPAAEAGVGGVLNWGGDNILWSADTLTWGA